ATGETRSSSATARRCAAVNAAFRVTTRSDIAPASLSAAGARRPGARGVAAPAHRHRLRFSAMAYGEERASAVTGGEPDSRSSAGAAWTAGQRGGRHRRRAGLLGHSAVMAAGSLVSRLTGFLRTAVIAAALGGVSLVGDAYTTAMFVPGMVYELLLGGILASVVVPLLVRAHTHDPDAGEAYTHRLLSLAVLALGVTTALAVAAAPLLTALLAGSDASPASRDLITRLGYLILP